MEVFVNRKPVEVAEATTLEELLRSQQIAPEGTAAAVNNRVVPRAAWSATQLEEGAKITVIRAVCGG